MRLKIRVDCSSVTFQTSSGHFYNLIQLNQKGNLKCRGKNQGGRVSRSFPIENLYFGELNGFYGQVL